MTDPGRARCSRGADGRAVCVCRGVGFAEREMIVMAVHASARTKPTAFSASSLFRARRRRTRLRVLLQARRWGRQVAVEPGRGRLIVSAFGTLWQIPWRERRSPLPHPDLRFEKRFAMPASQQIPAAPVSQVVDVQTGWEARAPAPARRTRRRRLRFLVHTRLELERIDEKARI